MSAVAVRPAEPRRPLRRRLFGSTPALVAGAVLVTIFVGVALASLALHGQAYSQDLIARLQPPAWQSGGHAANLLGTDSLGRDVLARIMTGCRISLEIGLAAVAIGGILGVVLGMVAGYFGGWLDDIVMRITDAVLAIPIVLFALSVIAVVGGGIRNLILVIAFTQWMTYARTARGETLVLRETPFVTAARSLGSGHAHILRRHILPHLLPSAIVLATLNVSTAVLLEAGLSFLGLGVQPPDPSLGSMLTEGRQYITRAPWLAIYPGLALLLLVLGINLLGDGLRARIDRTGSRR
jgi:peptide/nickel transport system permease protein